MAKADIAALLALGAAFFIAIGDVMHQRSAHEVTDEPVGHLELFTQAAARTGSGGWAALVAAVGFALQAAALGFGSVLLVQALLVTSLLFALPINARADAPTGDALGVDVGGAAGRGGGGDRDRRQPDGGPLARLAGDLDGGGRRAGSRAGALRAWAPASVRVRSARCCWRWCPARCGGCSRC